MLPVWLITISIVGLLHAEVGSVNEVDGSAKEY